MNTPQQQANGAVVPGTHHLGTVTVEWDCLERIMGPKPDPRWWIATADVVVTVPEGSTLTARGLERLVQGYVRKNEEPGHYNSQCGCTITILRRSVRKTDGTD